MSKKIVVGYCRFQNGENRNIYSMEEQKEAIEKYASENSYEIVEVFEDKNVSGKKFNRKGLNKMLEFINSNPEIRILIVSDVSRLAVKLDESWWSLKRFLKSKGVELISLVHDMSKYIGKQPKQHF